MKTLNSVLWQNGVKKTTKNIYKTLVESTILYGAGVWDVIKAVIYRDRLLVTKSWSIKAEKETKRRYQKRHAY